MVWRDEVWWANQTWEDRAPSAQNRLPDFDDLKTYPFIVAIFVTGLRHVILEPFVFRYIISTVAGHIHKKKPAAPHPHSCLEQLYTQHKSPAAVPAAALLQCCQQLGWEGSRRGQRWLRARHAAARPDQAAKINETLWKLIFNFSIFCFGVFTVYDKEWLWDVRQCWDAQQRFPVCGRLWWYYQASLGAYLSMLASLLGEHRRKDFPQLCVHHAVTIALIALSYVTNNLRIGCLVLVCHGAADIPMCLGKLFLYTGCRKGLADACLAVFCAVWLHTRCVYYPCVLVKACILYSHQCLGPPLYYAFITLLSTLAVLHFFWTYYIALVVYKLLFTGKLTDSRSDDEESEVEVTLKSARRRKKNSHNK